MDYVNFSMCCYRLPVVPPLGRSPSRGSEKKIRAEKNKKKKKNERKKEIEKRCQRAAGSSQGEALTLIFSSLIFFVLLSSATLNEIL